MAGIVQPFIFIVHGQVGIFPIAQDAEALEFLLLDVNEFGGIRAAFLAHLQLAHLVLFGTEVFLHLQLDREAVAVPPRHVGGAETLHPFDFQYDVLEGFVERMADMDMSVGVGGAVMQDVERFVFAG